MVDRDIGSVGEDLNLRTNSRNAFDKKRGRLSDGMTAKTKRASVTMLINNCSVVFLALVLWCCAIYWLVHLSKQMFIPGIAFKTGYDVALRAGGGQMSRDSALKANTKGVDVDFGPTLPEFNKGVDVTARLDGEPVVFMILSARSHFEERQAVRETWGKDMINLIFVVGAKWCWWPPSLQDSSGPCELLKGKKKAVARSYTVVLHNRKQRALQGKLVKEQEQHGDLLILDIMDSYGNLSGKNLAMLTWLRSKLNHLPWVYKVDDDSIISVNRVLELLKQPNLQKYDFIGHLEPHSPVLKSGRWMELQYNATYYYPTYPRGSTGYLLNGELVSKIVKYNEKHPLPIYRCEDAAIGFWTWLHVLKQEGRTPRIYEDPRFVPNTFSRKSTLQECLDQVYRDARINYGHQLTPDSMRECYNYLSKLPSDPIGLDAPPLQTPEWFRQAMPTSRL